MDPSGTTPTGPKPPLQLLAAIGLVLGAVASLGYMFRTGSRNQSIVLMLMFAGWVALPYAAGAFAHRRARTWPPAAQNLLHALLLFLAAVPPVIYAHPPARQPASVFLLVPVASGVLLAGGWFVAGRKR